MVWSNFRICVPGKWVLVGEHSVLKGATAVALPHSDVSLDLGFEPDPNGLELLIEPPGAAVSIQELIDSIRDRRMSTGQSFPNPTGRLKVWSSIPISQGLGSSAALCVALTEWMAGPLGIPAEERVAFATELEHRFHGKSSGLDVSVIAAREPISFAMDRGAERLGVKKIPKFTFHDTGLRSRTSECVLRVERFREEVPALGVHVDEEMAGASKLALEGLARYDAGERKEGLQYIQRAMKLGQQCFYSWQLVPGEAKRLEEKLLSQGALAVKMTGSGGGGMLVALHEE